MTTINLRTRGPLASLRYVLGGDCSHVFAHDPGGMSDDLKWTPKNVTFRLAVTGQASLLVCSCHLLRPRAPGLRLDIRRALRSVVGGLMDRALGKRRRFEHTLIASMTGGRASLQRGIRLLSSLSERGGCDVVAAR
jgi:hypothetical protein